MIITKSEPYTPDEIEKVKEQFNAYVKTVIDVEKQICSAGCDRHFESEQILLEQGSKQSNIWGGGIDVETKTVDFNSFINIRPNQNNGSNEILEPKIREEYERLTRHFFVELFR